MAAEPTPHAGQGHSTGTEPSKKNYKNNTHTHTQAQLLVDDTALSRLILFSAKGRCRDTLRRWPDKEIRFSSCTRMNTNEAARNERHDKALKRLLDRLPPDSPTMAMIRRFAEDRRIGRGDGGAPDPRPQSL